MRSRNISAEKLEFRGTRYEELMPAWKGQEKMVNRLHDHFISAILTAGANKVSGGRSSIFRSSAVKDQFIEYYNKLLETVYVMGEALNSEGYTTFDIDRKPRKIEIKCIHETRGRKSKKSNTVDDSDMSKNKKSEMKINSHHIRENWSAVLDSAVKSTPYSFESTIAWCTRAISECVKLRYSITPFRDKDESNKNFYTSFSSAAYSEKFLKPMIWMLGNLCDPITAKQFEEHYYDYVREFDSDKIRDNVMTLSEYFAVKIHGVNLSIQDFLSTIDKDVSKSNMFSPVLANYFYSDNLIWSKYFQDKSNKQSTIPLGLVVNHHRRAAYKGVYYDYTLGGIALAYKLYNLGCTSIVLKDEGKKPWQVSIESLVKEYNTYSYFSSVLKPIQTTLIHSQLKNLNYLNDKANLTVDKLTLNAKNPSVASVISDYFSACQKGKDAVLKLFSSDYENYYNLNKVDVRLFSEKSFYMWRWTDSEHLRNSDIVKCSKYTHLHIYDHLFEKSDYEFAEQARKIMEESAA